MYTCMCIHVCVQATQGSERPIFSVLSHFSPVDWLIARERDYLAFIARVTQDILARRVYTDVGLKLLFEEHTEKNRDLLDVVSVCMHAK